MSEDSQSQHGDLPPDPLEGSPEALTTDDFDALRKLIATKLDHLALEQKYDETSMELDAPDDVGIFDAILQGKVKKTDEVGVPGLHIMRREAEFLLPDGNHLVLRRSNMQFEDTNPTSPEAQDEDYEVKYFALLGTDDAGRKRITEQNFDFSTQAGFPEKPEAVEFRVEDFEITPPGVLASRIEAIVNNQPRPPERYDRLQYTRDQHEWLTEVINGITPEQQLPPEECWFLTPEPR